MSDLRPQNPSSSAHAGAPSEDTAFAKMLALLDRLIPGRFVCLSPEPGLPCLYANRAFFKVLGYGSSKQFLHDIGDLFENCVHPEDAPALASVVEQMAKGTSCGDPDVAFRVRKRDRAYAWISFTGNRFENDGNAVVVCACIDRSVNISARRDLEESLRTLRELKDGLENIIANMPGGLHVFKLGAPSKIVYSSDRLCAMTGYSRAEVSERFRNQFTEMLHADDRSLLQQALFDLAEYPHTVTVSYRIVRGDGSILYVTDTLRSARDRHGAMWAYGIAINDTSDELLLSGVSGTSSHIPYPIACFDWSEQVLSPVYCNEEFSSIMGLTPAEYLARAARNPLSLSTEQSRRDILALLAEFEQGRNRATIDVTVAGKQGPQRCTLVINVISRCGSTFRTLALLENDFYRELGSLARSDRGASPKAKRVYIRTFGFFDVFVDGKALSFHSAKAKELLALLVDRRGGFVTSAEVIGNLWEDEDANKVTRARCRKIAMRLLNELREHGVDDIVESAGNGARRIVPEKVDCDLFDYLAGKPEGLALFRGSYLANYSWGEYTLAELYASTGSGANAASGDEAGERA